MDLGIEGRIALVTGADSGIGLAAVKELTDNGVRVIVSDLDELSLKKATDGINGVEAMQAADLTKQRDIDALHGFCESRDMLPDILVNCAGITGAKGDPLTLDDDDWMACWHTNFMSVVRMCRAFIPGMAERGWGRVVAITSENAVQPYWDEAVYNTSKAALLNFVKGLSGIYAQKGVLVNTVAPAFIETPMTDGMMDMRSSALGVDKDEAVRSFLKEERPFLELERRGKPEEAAAVIAFLCSERASFINGSNYRVDGGAVATMQV